ncbi:MAG: excinuclease ABC subunit A, partial [Bacteroidota bacterium]
ELDGMTFLEPAPQLFNYNNPYGACPRCEGYGKIMGIDENKVIPIKSKSVFDGAVVCWNGDKSKKWLNRFILKSEAYDFPIHRPYNELTKEERKLLWEGSSDVNGIRDYFDELTKKTYKIQNRVMLARYRGRTKCNVCDGARLRPEANYVKVGKTSIGELIHLPIEELFQFFTKLELSAYDQEVGNRILFEIKNRLQIMMNIGLKYLSLERTSATLSGGETQRINLTRTLGSNLSNSLYILDEPSIGLHPNDTKKLVEVLKNLRDLGNTVIVVEHEEDVIMNADHIIDIGPKAGIFGGELVYEGSLKKLLAKSTKNESLTKAYLSGTMSIATPEFRRKKINAIQILGASQHNLRNINATFPLNTLVAVSGV